MKTFGMTLLVLGLVACGGKIAGSNGNAGDDDDTLGGADDDGDPSAGGRGGRGGRGGPGGRGGQDSSCEDAVTRILAKYQACDSTQSASGAGEIAAICETLPAAQAEAVADCLDATSCAALSGEDRAAAEQFSECILDGAR